MAGVSIISVTFHATGYKKMNQIVSIIGDSYLQPIALLLEKLFDRDIQLDDIKAGFYENGYSASICVLSALWFESYSMRVRYINKAHPSSKKTNAIKFLMELYTDFPFETQLTEVFIVRDLIVHNNLWHIDFEWPDINSEDFSQKLIAAEKDEFGGDKKYEKFVDTKARKTKALQLNVVPIAINRCDACKVIRVLYDSLSFIERKNINQCAVTNSQIIFEGKRFALQELITELENRLC